MRVTVDDDRCRGHGICCSLCPEVFDIGDSGFAVVAPADVVALHTAAVLDAVAGCPEGALSVDQ